MYTTDWIRGSLSFCSYRTSDMRVGEVMSLRMGIREARRGRRFLSAEGPHC